MHFPIADLAYTGQQKTPTGTGHRQTRARTRGNRDDRHEPPPGLWRAWSPKRARLTPVPLLTFVLQVLYVLLTRCPPAG
jgi:hypothetical protein